MATVSLDQFAPVDGSDTISDGMELLDTNWQTTAAVGLTVASGGIAGAIMLSALPAQTLLTGATITGLAVVGKRRADGQDPYFGIGARFSKKSDEKAEATEPEVTADAAPEAA